MTARTIALLLFLALGLAAQETIVRDRFDEVYAAALADGARPWDHDEVLWQVGIRDHGQIEPVLVLLRAELEGLEGRVRRARILIGLLLERDGRAEEALPVLEAVAEAERDLDLQLELAQLRDLLGKTDDARAAYQALLDRELPADLKKTVLLRLALLDPGKNYDGFLAYARGDDLTPERRNEAAVILALGDRQLEAVELFTVTGEKGDRYRQLVRLAEWALGGQNFAAAQTFAWAAVDAAITKRDRRYGLSLVISAYRAADQIDALLLRFAEEAKLHDDTRRMWIEVLREEGRATEALRLVREGAGSDWTPALKRQLLEICREAGEVEVLVANYRELIAAEPENLEWRSGLSRHYLENGQREEARAVWSGYLGQGRSADDLLEAARGMEEVGLADLAVDFAREAARTEARRAGALLFIAQLEQQRGRYEAAVAVLQEIDASAEPGAGIRAEVAGEYERIGRIDLAVATLESLRRAHDDFLGTDLEMKYALSLSKLGREDEALVVWRELWTRLRGTPRGRYVEDRLMTVASRIGKLAKIAIELEDRLAQGSADTKDIDLLVRLYIKVNDPASATEIVEEYLKRIGSADLDILKRKAQVYAACSDFYHYEEVCHQLIELDVDNRLDHMRELVMSQLDRGRRDQAIAMLPKIRAAGGDQEDIADEFEAGVYGLAGMKNEALESYMRGMGRAPDRIDTLLLIANLLQETGREMQAARRFQYLAMRADKDDLFTIAIDGILNLRAPRETRVPPAVVSWARRVCLERLARNADRFYLHRLVTDLAEDLNDLPFAIRCLKAAVPIAGERRTPLLREIMSKCRSLDRRARQNFGLDSGIKVSPDWNADDYLMVGRRLLGQGEYVPPQVFMDMAAVFLAKDRIDDAMRTFSRASELLDRGEVTLQAAQVLEKARHYQESLTFYRRLLATEAGDVVLIEKVAELEELSADEKAARDLYARGLDVALGQLARRVTREVESETDPEDPWGPRGGNQRNLNALDVTVPKLVAGLMATIPDREAAREFTVRMVAEVDEQLAALDPESGGRAPTIAEHPRLARSSEACRRIGLIYRMPELVDPADARLLAAFPQDRDLLRQAIVARTQRGLDRSAAELLRGAGKETDLELAALAGIAALDGRRLSPAAVAQEIVPRSAEPEVLARLIERVDCARLNDAEVRVLPQLMAAALTLDLPSSAENFARAAIRLIAGRGYEALDQGMAMLGVASRVSPQLSRELLEVLVDRVLEREPQLASALSWRIEEIPGIEVSDELIRRVAKRMVEVAVKGRPVYGLSNWVQMLPEGDRPALTRELHDALEADQKLAFLVDVSGAFQDPLDDAFVAWFGNAMTAALEATGSNKPQYTNYGSGREGSSVKLRLAVIDALEKAGAGESLQLQRWLIWFEQGRDDEVVAALLADIDFLLGARRPGASASYSARQVLDRLATSPRASEVLSLIETRLATATERKPLEDLRLDLAAKIGGPAYGRIIEAMLAEKPDDAGLLGRLRQHHLREGNAIAALRILIQLAEAKPDDDNLQWQLMQAYLVRHMPLEAEGIRLALEAKKIAAENGQGGAMAAVKLQAAGIVVARGVVRIGGEGGEGLAGIRKQLEEGHPEQARAALRRLWRGLGSTDRYQPGISYRLAWNERPQKPAKEGEKLPRTILGALADVADFVPDEARRVLCFLEDEDEAPDEEVVNELIELTLPRDEPARRTLLERLTTDAVAGQGGAMEVARIFILLEDSWVDDAERARIIDSLVARRSIPEARQLRGLARGLAVGGRKEVAARLYAMTALLANAARDGGYLSETENWRELIHEAHGVLGEELGLPTALRMLVNLRPTDYRLASWCDLAMDVWESFLPVEQALEQALALRAAMDDERDFWMLEQIRPTLVRLALKAGRRDQVLANLAPAIGKNVAVARNRRGFITRVDRNAAQTRGSLSRIWSSWDRKSGKQVKLDVDLPLLCDCLVELEEHDDLAQPAAAFGALASRYCELEPADPEFGRRLTDRLRGYPDDDDQHLRVRAAIERKIGETEIAYGLESVLRARGRLTCDRLAQHLHEYAEHEGAGKALDLGVEMAEFCNEPALLDEVVRLAAALEDEGRATKFRELKEAVVAQDAADKERLEAEKEAPEEEEEP
ncbi:MAG: hypothetical protein H6807_05040 [Planctomycetes bacterium]|nr:hypothetical protein [Planctomycetota bacterium]